ncbi:MAG: DUF3592 domain-containing protein [Lachnospiraceae bacterium]
MKKSSIYYPNILKLIGWIFAVAGVIMLVVAVIVGFSTQSSGRRMAERGVAAEATITSISRNVNSDSTDVYIAFEDQTGKTLNIKLNMYSSDMYEGKVLNITYDPENPSKIRLNDSFMLTNLPTIICGGLSFGYLILGTTFLFFTRKNKARKYLMEEGRAADAELVRVDYKTNVKINGAHPYVLVCQYMHNDGQVYMMSSQMLKFDPTSYLYEGHVRFYYDNNDVTKYYIDVEGSMNRQVVEI